MNKTFQRIETPEAAAFLNTPASFQYLEPFLGRERSLRQAAEDLGLSMTALHYWVQKMLKLGILKVSREEQRKGRPIRHYRTVADQFFVPFALTPLATFEELFREREDNYLVPLVRGIAGARRNLERDWGTLHERDAGRMHTRFMALKPVSDPPADPPAVMSGWVNLRLSHAHARELQDRMQSWFAELAELPEDPVGTPYLLHLAIAPEG